jgi:RimJ/RimL family protein N-acetyltransferase
MSGAVVETERLILRPFSEEDLDSYARIMSDPEVVRWLHGQPLDRTEAWRAIAQIRGHWDLRGYGLWAAEEKSTGKLVGRIGVQRPEGWPGLEAAWTVDRERWGEGFATEGGIAAIEYAFNTLDADHVISLILPKNIASIRVAEKIGERLERTIEFMGLEVCVYGITRA